MTQPGGIVVEHDLEAMMRDGTPHRADAYRPDGATDLPTLLCRTPYDMLDGACLEPVRIPRSLEAGLRPVATPASSQPDRRAR